MNARYEIAREIVRLTAEYEAGHLKRTARDFISGMVKAYGILIDVHDADAAYARAKDDARLAPHGGCNWSGCTTCFPKSGALQVNVNGANYGAISM